ncbi:MAG: long-chain fatty acid--CoA ligase [Treponema sp.]|nr:long-chain fatty acid--CoA ligase [Candidatus Treponema caballi]
MKRNIDRVDHSLPDTLPALFMHHAETYADLTLQASKDKNGVFVNYTFREVFESILTFAAALQSVGVKRNDRIAIISDNRREWLITDQAIQTLGAADVPRGCDSMAPEIRYIISFSECNTVFFENQKQLKKVTEKLEDLPLLKTAILFDMPEEKPVIEGLTIYSFNELLEKGKSLITEMRESLIEEIGKTKKEDLATIIFTSGTTGTPKGVMLTHRNYMAQLEVVHTVLTTKPGEMWLSVLPVWHSFERTLNYMAVTLGSGIAYSKPIAPVLLPDLQKIRPQWMTGVPRLWESLAHGVEHTMKKKGGFSYKVYRHYINIGKKYAQAKEYATGAICHYVLRPRSLDVIWGIFPFLGLFIPHLIGEVLVYRKIRAKFGGRVVAALSGGGALQPDVDDFYKAIGFKLLEGYGITEAGPVLSVRNCKRPRAGGVGEVYPAAVIKIVKEKDGVPVSDEPLGPGHVGLIFARGDQIMKGYYRQPEMTSKVITPDGWLNTGDLGMISTDNEIKITGRAKDTIVMLDGENIEPLGIETAICTSPYIETAVVIGQDRKALCALIVPSKKEILDYAAENDIRYSLYEDLLETPAIISLIRCETDKKVSQANGFRTSELISRFCLLPDSFRQGEELSAKGEIKRFRINELYAEQIESMYKL